VRLAASLWIPAGFTGLYLALTLFVGRRLVSQDPVGAGLAVTIATVSAAMLWVFYALCFLLRLRHPAAVLVVAGFACPAVVTAALFLLLGL